MSDTRNCAWPVNGKKRKLTLREQVVCLEIDLALIKEAYEARLAGHPSVSELPIFKE